VGKTPSTDAITVDSHCITPTGKIYAVDSSNTVKDVTADNDVLVFEMSAAGKFTQVTLGSGTITPGNVVLYQCANGKCQQTDGYIADSANKYAISSRDKALSKSEAGASACADASNNFGKLGSSDVLCLGESESITFPSTAEVNHYVLKGTLDTGTPFKITGGGIILTTYANAIIHEQFKIGKWNFKKIKKKNNLFLIKKKKYKNF